MKEKIQFFPISAFTAIMGFAGLTIVLGKFSQIQWLPSFLYEISLILSLSLFALLILMYTLKLIWFIDNVKADLVHPTRVNFFSTISISMLLISVALNLFYPYVARIIWWAGVSLHTFILLKTISFWMQNRFEVQQFNPVWFIPVVGSMIIPINGVDFAPLLFSYIFFAAGFFFWVILFTLFMFRTIFYSLIPQKLIPTLFILLVPPSIGFISYMRITGSWDSFAITMLSLAYFISVLLLFMYKVYKNINFNLSWWAFTFPLTAVATASTIAYQISLVTIFKIFAWLFLSAALFAFVVVTWNTMISIRKGEICKSEE
ncbi:MAG: SLAC1 anion channel family protein [Bacteroidales bacterium]|nr:SLAC1 anion channel family protein [Bacteroidales bacterium]